MTDWLLHLYQFRFASPWMLLTLALLPLWIFLRGRRGGVPSVPYSSAGLLRAALHAQPRSRPLRGLILLRYSAINLMILALARPQVERDFVREDATGVNIMLNLDYSSGMRAKEFTLGHRRVGRGEALRELVAEFVRARPNDRIGAVRFAAGARVISPLTLDHAWLLEQLVEEEPGGDASPGSGMLVGAEALMHSQDRSKVLLTLIGAGQIKATPPLPEVARSIASLGIKSHIVQIVDFKTIHEASAVVPALEQAARITGGQFFQAADAGGLRDVYRQIDKLEKASLQQSTRKGYRELMGWFLAAAFLILLAELMLEHLVWSRLP